MIPFDRVSLTLKRFWANESGATSAMEYGLLAALLGIACVLAFTATGDGLQNLFGNNGAGPEMEAAAATAAG